MIDFQQKRFNFPSTTGRSQSVTLAFVFNSRVNRAEAAINGFDIGFSRIDNLLSRAQVDVDTAINNNTVNVTVNYALRDNTISYMNNAFHGSVDVLVIIDRE